MRDNTLAELMKLPVSTRVEIAMALWESLADSDRGAELALTPEQEVELDRRLAEHLADPDSAKSWDEVRRDLTTTGRGDGITAPDILPHDPRTD